MATRKRLLEPPTGACPSVGVKRVRTLVPPSDAAMVAAPVAPQRARALDKPRPEPFRPRSDGPRTLTGTLAAVEKLQSVEQRAQGRRKRQTPSSSSDATTSESSGEKGAARTRELKRRQRNRAKHYLEEWTKSTIDGRSFLADRSVSKKTLGMYKDELVSFKTWVAQRKPIGGIDFGDSDVVDPLLVMYLEDLFFQGNMPNRGDYVVASVMFNYPRLSKGTRSSLPQAWRALKGWRKVSPPRSRLPEVKPFWMGVAMLFCSWGLVSMAAFVLLSLSTYLRPTQLFGMKKRHLIAPLVGVSGQWAVLANPTEMGKPSKVGEFDVSIVLDSPWLSWAGPVYERLKAGPSGDPLFEFGYPELLVKFRLAVAWLGRPRTVPYQLRHSGPSIDRSEGLRSLAEVKKRGQWKADKSVVRYEKAARLTSQGHSLDPQVWTYLRAAERELPAVMVFGRPPPPPPPPPAARGPGPGHGPGT